MTASGRILLVDDSPIALDVIGSKLSEHGLEVVTCDSAGQALSLATGEALPFHLFILDVMMPEMTGHELTRRLREHPRTANTPILLLTSLGSTDDRVAGLNAGADDFFTKAEPDAEMLARVRSFVSLGKLRAQLLAQQETMANLSLGEGSTTETAERVAVVHASREEAERLATAIRHSGSGLALQVRAVVSGSTPLEVSSADVFVISWPLAMEGASPLLTRYGFDETGPVFMVVDDAESGAHRVAAFEAGAADYLSSSTPQSELLARLASTVRRQRRALALREARDRAAVAAVTDALTGTYNRRYFTEALKVEWARAERYRRSLALAIVDIDHFKQVNDTLGHQGGDEAIRELASRLKAVARSTDVVARYGGEEFAVILPETTATAAQLAGERMRATIEGMQIHHGNASKSLTVSVGVAAFPEHCGDAGQLVELADRALYAAKRGGRNRVCVASTAEPGTPPSGPEAKIEELVARLRFLLSEDLDSPLALARHISQELVESTDRADPLYDTTAKLGQATRDAHREVERVLDDLAALARSPDREG